ncbi:histidine phosphatase family protein [Gilvimarinus agarilyticus]|uniref:histidine phosphatase family protein n=1 Tax=Gilvimarinus agarilyticus TaxID=679259 RepID=UPI0005A2A225|nr:histidine phosphatase family protein [Gilvimarinus agarilyticus]
MRAFALIRHGDYQQKPDTPSAHQPYPLTENGEQQARHCAAQLVSFAAELGLALAPTTHSSSLQRAWQTATIIRRSLAINNAVLAQSDTEIIQTHALTERCVGSVANLTIAEIEQILAQDSRYAAAPKHWKSSADYCLPFPGAESLRQAGKRVAEYIKQVNSDAPDNTLTPIVGHGAAFRHACCELGILSTADIQRLSMHHAQPVIIGNDNDSWVHLAGHWKTRDATRESID